MVIYEVSLEINADIYSEYYQWLITHIQQMLQFKGFKSAEVNLIQHDEMNDKKRLRIEYFIDSDEDLQDYFTQHAATMRNDAIKKFGTQFSATRRILSDPIRFDAD